MKNMKSFQDRNYSTSSIKRSAKDKYVARSLFSSGFTTIAATTGKYLFWLSSHWFGHALFPAHKKCLFGPL